MSSYIEYLYFIIVLYIIQIIEYDYTRLISVLWGDLSVESPSPQDPATPPGQSEGPPGRQWLSQGSARQFVKTKNMLILSSSRALGGLPSTTPPILQPQGGQVPRVTRTIMMMMIMMASKITNVIKTDEKRASP